MSTTRFFAISLLAALSFSVSGFGASAQTPPATAPQDAAKSTGNPKVALQTSMGKIVLELYQDAAPKTVASFLAYVDSGFYDGLIFHRVIDGFMIQGGGFTPDMKQKPPSSPPVPNEANNGLRNERGTVAMARTNQPHSATCQFFINAVDNAPLDHKNETPQGWGYAVFARVIEGMNVVDQISKVPTTRFGGASDVPVEPVIIVKASRAH